GFKLIVDISRVVQFTCRRVDREDLTWPETTFGNHICWVIGIDAYLRRHSNNVVFGNHPARGAQAVAVEGTNRVATIGDHQPRRTIPRLNMHGVVFVESA